MSEDFDGLPGGFIADRAMRQERAAIVAWLRALPAGNSDWCAEQIERGEHLTTPNHTGMAGAP
jgi:hypothetical protein